MQIRTLIVDDEMFARDGIRDRLKRERDFEVVGEAADGPNAIRAIKRLSPDLVILDLQMPGFDGIEVLRRTGHDVDPLPLVVFVTAHEHYAVQAFEADAVDYLLKPFAENRFQEMLKRVRLECAKQMLLRQAQRGRPDGGDALTEAPQPRERAQRLIVKDRDRFVILNTQEINWINSADNYLELHARGRMFLMRATMHELDETLNPDLFARIHRSTIVRIGAVAEILPSEHGDFLVVLEDGTRLRLSRKYRDRLFSTGQGAKD